MCTPVAGGQRPERRAMTVQRYKLQFVHVRIVLLIIIL